MNPASRADPFSTLGLPARPGLTDDEVRAAWRRIAAASHPDRADGGDPARFAAAAAAYTVLRTQFGRSEALADLAERRRGTAWRRRAPAPDGRVPGDAVPGDRWPDDVVPGDRGPAAARPADTRAVAARTGYREAGDPPAPRPVAAATGGPGNMSAARLLIRAWWGRPALLALRLAIVGAVSATAIAVAGAAPATPALITGAVTWLLLTARHDLAPPP